MIRAKSTRQFPDRLAGRPERDGLEAKCATSPIQAPESVNRYDDRAGPVDDLTTSMIPNRAEAAIEGGLTFRPTNKVADADEAPKTSASQCSTTAPGGETERAKVAAERTINQPQAV